jgi:valyl-tRNA synthetase
MTRTTFSTTQAIYAFWQYDICDWCFIEPIKPAAQVCRKMISRNAIRHVRSTLQPIVVECR